MIDFYDDAILEFDDDVKRVFTYLKDTGRIKNTIIIITTDHGCHGSIFRTYPRLPLIIRFPHQEHKGRINRNVQVIDIAPTILDYMGTEIPDWMEGVSLLSGDPDMYRPIIAACAAERRGPKGRRSIAHYKEPFYSLGRASVIICHKWYHLTLKDRLIFTNNIEGHTAPCDEDKLPSVDEVKEFIIAHLEDSGYDVSSLRKP